MLAAPPGRLAGACRRVRGGRPGRDAAEWSGMRAHPVCGHVRSVRQAERLRRRLCRPLSRLRHVELSRSKPSGLRVHLCPELPNQIEEMQLAESSTWGLSTCVGASQALYLTKGVRFRLQFMDQSEEFTWVGVRGHVSFVIPAVEDGGRAPAAGDSDSRRILDGEVRIEML